MASSLCCIAGIAGLSSQKTARIGNASGIIGIVGGLSTALVSMNFTSSVLTQALVLLSIGISSGAYVGKNVAIT